MFLSLKYSLFTPTQKPLKIIENDLLFVQTRGHRGFNQLITMMLMMMMMMMMMILIHYVCDDDANGGGDDTDNNHSVLHL